MLGGERDSIQWWVGEGTLYNGGWGEGLYGEGGTLMVGWGSALVHTTPEHAELDHIISEHSLEAECPVHRVSRGLTYKIPTSLLKRYR